MQPTPAAMRRRRSLVSLAPERRATSLSPRCRGPKDAPWTATCKPVSRDELLCPICFDILCFPVTLPCGHNFDRGCLLTAWEHEPHATSALDTPHDGDPHSHACPLCRQRTPAATAGHLQVNLVLKKLIAMQYPLEIQGLECEAKCRAASSSTMLTAPSQRRRRTWRTAASFFYVWLASVTEPPGFVLAVLLLMSLLAIALTPQQMIANPTALPTLFEGLDCVINALLLLVREIAFRMDQLDQVWPWMQVFSFIL